MDPHPPFISALSLLPLLLPPNIRLHATLNAAKHPNWTLPPTHRSPSAIARTGPCCFIVYSSFQSISDVKKFSFCEQIKGAALVWS